MLSGQLRAVHRAVRSWAIDAVAASVDGRPDYTVGFSLTLAIGALFPAFGLMTPVAVNAVRVIRAAFLVAEILASAQHADHYQNCQGLHMDLQVASSVE